MRVCVKDIVDFYNKHPECIGNIDVDTRFGFKSIEYADITAFSSKVLKFVTNLGKKIFVSPKHKFLSKELSWVTSDILSIGSEITTRDGLETIIDIELQSKREDLYDLQVAEVKEYYANNIVSHNSTLLDATTFALYGKPFRKINKPQLVNSINQKDLIVEVEFSVGKTEYLVRRGIKPNVFEIYKDGELLNQNAATRDYQSYLEENILKINFKAFTQIVILGSATYVPFMELTAQSRREVIEDLLDIQVFSTMNLLLKERIATNKESVVNCKHEINVLKSKIESSEKHNESIRKMRAVEVEKIKDRVRIILADINSNMVEIESIQKEVELLISKISDKTKVSIRSDKIRQLKAELNARKRTLEEVLEFYNNHDNCPTCKQGIEHKDDIISVNVKSLDEVLIAMSQLSDKVAIVDERLREIADVELDLQKKNNKIGETRASIRLKKNQLQEFKTDLENAEKEMKEVDRTEILDYSTQLKGIESKHQTLIEERETLAIVSSMLKDGGIKTRIIRQYIPIINKLINKYLAAFDLFVDFQLDENFNEVIKSRFRDTFSYASFSEGEKLRISMAILLTWRAVSKMRSSISTNLLIMDEVLDSGMDSAGTDYLIEVLNGLTAHDNVFVISHKDTSYDKFNSHIKFVKTKNFSVIESNSSI